MNFVSFVSESGISNIGAADNVSSVYKISECPERTAGGREAPKAPKGPSASPALNNVECWATKKIIFSLASRPGRGS